MCLCLVSIVRSIEYDDYVCLLRAVILVFQTHLTELISMIILQGRVLPFPLRLQEEGK